MWNPFKKRRLKRDWRLVSTLKASFRWTNEDNRICEVYYYLSENGLGKRKCDHDAADYNSCVRAPQHPYYLKNIKPWLKGRYDPDIPSYESIKAKEMKDKLAGRIT